MHGLSINISVDKSCVRRRNVVHLYRSPDRTILFGIHVQRLTALKSPYVLSSVASIAYEGTLNTLKFMNM